MDQMFNQTFAVFAGLNGADAGCHFISVYTYSAFYLENDITLLAMILGFCLKPPKKILVKVESKSLILDLCAYLAVYWCRTVDGEGRTDVIAQPPGCRCRAWLHYLDRAWPSSLGRGPFACCNNLTVFCIFCSRHTSRDD